MQDIVVIGAGNLAWHLIVVLQQAGFYVTLVSRKPETVADWPVPVIRLDELIDRPDLVILAVPDDAIGPVTANLTYTLPPEIPVIHTSGATPVTAIDAYFRQRGALWPIRSLRQGEPVHDWHDLPLAYHGSDAALTQVLGKLAGKLSDLVYALDDDQRAKLHLAAVFSNNFVTWLYEISHELCTESEIPFEALLPIIRNTALKQDGTAPRLTQTGAAARGDTATIARHLGLLDAHPDYARLYHFMSNLIQEGISQNPD